MSDLEAVSSPDYRDRQAGLIIFGIILVLMGGLCFLAIPMMFLGVAMSSRTIGAEAISMQMVLPGAFMYAGVAVAMIWLGIGSIVCRRWARTLILIGAALWLVGGSEGFIVSMLMYPQMLEASPTSASVPPVMMNVIMAISMSINAVIFVVIPLVLTLFYKSPHVKATCEARDPKVRWTDTRPLPILALAVILGMSVFVMPMGCINPVLPFFGTYLTGLPAVAVLLALSFGYGYAAISTFKLKIAGWWTALMLYGLSSVSAMITYLTVGIGPMYEHLKLPSKQLQMLQKVSLFEGPGSIVLVVMYALPLFVFLFYARRFFKEQ